MDTQGPTGDNWEEQLIDYSIGAMEPDEAAAFETELEECRTHVRLARQYEQAVAWLGASVPAADPPQGHKNRLMARVTSTPQSVSAKPAAPGVVPTSAAEGPTREEATVTDLARYREQRRRNNTLVAVMATVAAALILLVGLWALNANKPPTQVNVPPGYKPLILGPLSPQVPMTGAVALVFYNPEKNDAILVADRLPVQPIGKVYELWLLPSGANEIPTASGVFTPDAQGSSQHTTTTPKKVGEYAGFAVSIEDAPGQPVGKPPAGPVVLAGTFAAP